MRSAERSATGVLTSEVRKGSGPQRYVRTAFQSGSEEQVLGTKRTPLTQKDLEDRLKRTAQKAAAAEEALDAMVRRSIEVHGP